MFRWLFASSLAMVLLGSERASATEPVPAASAVRDTLLDKIGAKYKPIEVLQASFVQTTKSAYGDDQVKGTILLKRPGQMRWEFADGRQFVSDGQTLWIYTPAEKQVLKIANFGEQAATADLVLQSMHKLRELFEVQLVSSDAVAGHVLALTPKTGQTAQFQKLTLALDSTLLLDKVTITDDFGTNTLLDFEGLVLGGTTKPTDFQFQVPPGVTVIDSG